MSLMSLTAVELGRKIKEKEVTVEEAVTAALDAIEKREAQVHSFVTVDREGALKRAKEVQAKINAGELTGGAMHYAERVKNEYPQYDVRVTILGHLPESRGGNRHAHDGG